jgi:hypothetical protein
MTCVRLYFLAPGQQSFVVTVFPVTRKEHSTIFVIRNTRDEVHEAEQPLKPDSCFLKWYRRVARSGLVYMQRRYQDLMEIQCLPCRSMTGVE